MNNNLLYDRVRDKVSISHLLLFAIIVSYLTLVNLLNQHLSNDHVKFLLYPAQEFIHYTSGKSFEYFVEYGYVQSDGLIRINKSCSGFLYLNVLIILGVAAIILNKHVKNKEGKTFFVLLFSLLLSYIVCLIVNCSRIVLGIRMQNFSNFHSWFPNHFAHEMFGIIYFLLFAIVYYLVIKKIVKAWIN